MGIKTNIYTINMKTAQCTVRRDTIVAPNLKVAQTTQLNSVSKDFENNLFIIKHDPCSDQVVNIVLILLKHSPV